MHRLGGVGGKGKERARTIHAAQILEFADTDTREVLMQPTSITHLLHCQFDLRLPLPSMRLECRRDLLSRIWAMSIDGGSTSPVQADVTAGPDEQVTPSR